MVSSWLDRLQTRIRWTASVRTESTLRKPSPNIGAKTSGCEYQALWFVKDTADSVWWTCLGWVSHKTPHTSRHLCLRSHAGTPTCSKSYTTIYSRDSNTRHVAGQQPTRGCFHSGIVYGCSACPTRGSCRTYPPNVLLRVLAAANTSVKWPEAALMTVPGTCPRQPSSRWIHACQQPGQEYCFAQSGRIGMEGESIGPYTRAELPLHTPLNCWAVVGHCPAVAALLVGQLSALYLSPFTIVEHIPWRDCHSTHATCCRAMKVLVWCMRLLYKWPSSYLCHMNWISSNG